VHDQRAWAAHGRQGVCGRGPLGVGAWLRAAGAWGGRASTDRFFGRRLDSNGQKASTSKKIQKVGIYAPTSGGDRRGPLALGMEEEQWDSFLPALQGDALPDINMSVAHTAQVNQLLLVANLDTHGNNLDPIDGIAANLPPIPAVPAVPVFPTQLADRSASHDAVQVSGHLKAWQFHTEMKGRYDLYRNFLTSKDGGGRNPPCLRCQRTLKRPQNGGDTFYCSYCASSTGSTGSKLTFNIRIHKHTGELLIRQSTPRERGPYLCSFCGALKKGHNNACLKVAPGAAQTASSLPDGDDAAVDVDAALQDILQDRAVSADIFSGSMTDLVASTAPAAAARNAYQPLQPLTVLRSGRFMLTSGPKIRVIRRQGWLGTIGSFYVPKYELTMNRVFYFKMKGYVDFNVLRQMVRRRTSKLSYERYDGLTVCCNAFVALPKGSGFRIAAFRVDELVTFDHLMQDGAPWHFEIKMEDEQTVEYMPDDKEKEGIIARVREKMKIAR
jgi:hypothetical protein